MEKGTYITATITAKVQTRIKLVDGETPADFKNRDVDIYLHIPDPERDWYVDKVDLGADEVDIQVGSVTKVE